MCAVIRRGSSVGAIPTRQLVVPAGSNRSGGGGNEVAGAFDAKGQRVGPRADAREGQAGPAGMADGLVVPAKPGNAGGGKGPEFKEGAGRGTRARRVAMSLSPPQNGSEPPGGVPRPAARP